LHTTGIADDSDKWKVKEIKSHWGKGISAWFEVKYFSNESSWEPYKAICNLSALQEYFQDLGIDKISQL